MRRIYIFNRGCWTFTKSQNSQRNMRKNNTYGGPTPKRWPLAKNVQYKFWRPRPALYYACDRKATCLIMKSSGGAERPKKAKKRSSLGTPGPAILEDIWIIFSPAAWGWQALANVCKNIFTHTRWMGLLQRRTRHEKLTIFTPHLGACDPKPPTHTPQVSCALRSGIPSLSFPVPKKFWAVCRFSGKIFSIIVKNAEKLGQLWRGISKKWSNICKCIALLAK